jgi:hypothetical protein
LQPIAIPDVIGNVCDPKRIAEALCEFRRRMSDSEARQDKWWKHEATPESMAAAVCDAASTYDKVGRVLFDNANRRSS